MIEEISKIGEINSIGDFLDFKLSIKTIVILAILYFICAGIFVIFIFGGVNNTIDYANNILQTTKNQVVILKDPKHTTKDDDTISSKQ